MKHTAPSAIAVILITSELLVKKRAGLIPRFFYAKIDLVRTYLMDKDKLKLIVRNLELLVDSLKAEVYSDVSAYTKPKSYEEITSGLHDYDEIFDDDDGYPD